MFSSGFFILSRILFFRFIYPEFSVISSFVSAVKCIARFFLSVSTYLALPQTCIKSGFFGAIGRNADKSQTVPISVLLFRKELTERRKKHSVFRISRFRINTGFCRTKLAFFKNFEFYALLSFRFFELSCLSSLYLCVILYLGFYDF